MKKLSQEDIIQILDQLYDYSKTGIGKVSPSIEQLASDYLIKHQSIDDAAKSMLNHQIAKCTTSGFVTGFGGFLVMPITIPANISSVLYVQMRMIACTAYMAGFDLNSDQTQTFVYACLAGVSVNEIVKKFGVQLGQKVAKASIEKIPGKALTAINQKVGFRLITKFGEKGLINLGKMIAIAGAVINGGLDFAETKLIASRAYKQFICNDFTPDKNEDIIDISI